MAIETATSYSFRSVKAMIQVLVHFNPSLQIWLVCDALNDEIGAVVFHRMPDGTEKLIGLVLHTLSVLKRNIHKWKRRPYHVNRFRSYLCGHHFVNQTDHKPLLTQFNENILIPHQATTRIQRWAWILALLR